MRMRTGTRCPLSPAAAEAQPGVPSRNSIRGHLRSAHARNRRFRGFFRVYFIFSLCFSPSLPWARSAAAEPEGRWRGRPEPSTEPTREKKSWKVLLLMVFLLLPSVKET